MKKREGSHLLKKSVRGVLYSLSAEESLRGCHYAIYCDDGQDYFISRDFLPERYGDLVHKRVLARGVSHYNEELGVYFLNVVSIRELKSSLYEALRAPAKEEIYWTDDFPLHLPEQPFVQATADEL